MQRALASSHLERPDEAAILAQLARILVAPEFAGSKFMSGFLDFVVKGTIAGSADRIKQYTIATNVFQRDRGFDPQTDPVVRVQAGKVRRALQRYYYEEGRTDPVRIEVPKGTYVPTFSWQATNVPPPTTNEVRRSIDKPVVAVLPLENRSGDASQDFLAAGFAEDLSTELSRFAKLSVLAFHSTRQSQFSGADIGKIRRELKADFVVTGSLRSSESELRVNVQVISTQTESVIWAERFRRSRDATNLFDIQDEIIRNVVARVAGTNGAIQQSAAKSTRRKENATLSGYEAVLRALHCDKTHKPEDYHDAIVALEYAVEQEPEFAPALAWLATFYLDNAALAYDSIEDATEKGIRLAKQSVTLDPNSQDAHFAMAWSCLQQGDALGATSAAWKMVELNPGDAFFVGSGGWFLALAGDRVKGMEIIERSRRLNPSYPSWFHFIACLDHFERGDFEAAMHESDLMGAPDLFWDPLIKATSLGHLGRTEEAAKQLERLCSLNPRFEARPEFYIRCFVLPPELRGNILRGLEMAGLGSLELS